MPGSVETRMQIELYQRGVNPLTSCKKYKVRTFVYRNLNPVLLLAGNCERASAQVFLVNLIKIIENGRYLSSFKAEDTNTICG